MLLHTASSFNAMPLGRFAPASHFLMLIRWCQNVMAGAGGFEPPNDGIKNRCLTTWRRPNMSTVDLKSLCDSAAYNRWFQLVQRE